MSVSECTVIISLAYSRQNLERLDAVKHLWASPPLPLKKLSDYCFTLSDPEAVNKQGVLTEDVLQPIIKHTLVLEHGPYDSEGDSYVCKLLGCDPDELLSTLHVTDEMFFVNYPSGENL